MNLLQPLDKLRLYERIALQLRELIEKGYLKPGDKLPTERKLAEELNVSRTAIREALRAMESQGFIESKVGYGTFIREVTLKDLTNLYSVVLLKNNNLIKDLLEIRRILETEFIRLAVKRINGVKKNKIKKALLLMEKEIKEGGIGIKGDNAFHNEIAKAAENLAMQAIDDMCSELLSASRKSTLEIQGNL